MRTSGRAAVRCLLIACAGRRAQSLPWQMAANCNRVTPSGECCHVMGEFQLPFFSFFLGQVSAWRAVAYQDD